MSSLVLGDLILESLTPSVNAPLETLPFSWWSFEKIVDNNFKLSYSTFCKRLPQEVVNNNFSSKGSASSSPFYINHACKKGKNITKVTFKIKILIKKSRYTWKWKLF